MNLIIIITNNNNVSKILSFEIIHQTEDTPKPNFRS